MWCERLDVCGVRDWIEYGARDWIEYGLRDWIEYGVRDWIERLDWEIGC